MALPNYNSSNKITCPDSAYNNQKTFVFSGSATNPSMDIIQGANTLLSTSLKDLFITLTDYSTQNFTLPANGTKTLNACSVGSDIGEVQFIGILVTYPTYDDGNVLIETEEQYIKYEYPTGNTPLNIGKMMILTGSTKQGSGWDLVGSPGGFLLRNPHNDFDVEVQVLYFY